MGRLILKLSVVLFLASSLNASEIYEYIQNGQLDQAREKLSAVATASTRDGNALFYQGLLETSADKAARLFETALESNVDVKYQEVIYFRLAQCYLVTGKTKQLSRILAEYTARWEKGEYRAEMARLSILLDELQGDRESALRQCDRYLIDFSQGDNEQAGLIDKARLLEAQQDRKSVV